MRFRTILLVCGLGVSISACQADAGSDSRVAPARQTPERQTTTFYKHEDHRDLPIGTRMFYRRIPGGGYEEMWVRPGESGPLGRKPDIVIIK